MYDATQAIKQQLDDYGAVLDKEQARLEALARLSTGVNHEHIEARLSALQTSRKRLEEARARLAGKSADQRSAHA